MKTGKLENRALIMARPCASFKEAAVNKASSDIRSKREGVVLVNG